MNDARKTFHRDLEDVQQELIRISAGVVESIPKCTAVLLEQDLTGAESMISADDEIDARTIDLEDRCVQCALPILFERIFQNLKRLAPRTISYSLRAPSH